MKIELKIFEYDFLKLRQKLFPSCNLKKNCIQKSINSAIQRLLELFVLDRGLGWFLNLKIIFIFRNRSRARSKDFNFFSDRALVLDSEHKYNFCILLLKYEALE